MILAGDQYIDSVHRKTEISAPLEKNLPEIFDGSRDLNPDAMGYEHIAERTSQIIDEFALSMGSLELQRFVERLLKLADEFNSVNGLEASLDRD